MPGASQIVLFFACAIVSALALFAVVKSLNEGLDYRSFLLAVVLMTAMNALRYFDWNNTLQWAVIAVVDFAIIKKILDSTVYMAILGMAVWIGMQIVFFEYLSAPLSHALFQGVAAGS